MKKSELREIIRLDSRYYDTFSHKEQMKMLCTKDHFYEIRRYMKYLRFEEYYRINSESLHGVAKYRYKIFECFYARKKNRLGNLLGFYIKPGTLGAGTVIYHHGGVIINGGARLGKNCRLHGNNCIGNDGTSLKAPQIGDNVEIGFGAQVIGDVKVANNVKIGAGACVVKSCTVEGATLVGVPAQIVR